MKRDKFFQGIVIFIFVSVVFSGLCSAADYCIFYEHTEGNGAYLKAGVGNANFIGKRWNDMISSVWIQDGYKVTIYEHTDFKGKNYTLYGERGGKLYNLTDIGFNDMVSSYTVDSDTGRDSSANVSDSNICCKFYEHTNAQGSSFSSGAGKSNFVGNRWNDKISSVWVGEGYKVTVYEHTGFGGKSQTLYGRNGGSLYNLTDIAFNDSISSYSAERDTRGEWNSEQPEDSDVNAYCKFYEHTDGNGASFSAGIGSRNSLGRKWNDKISSVWVQQGYSVTIYEDNDLEGESYTLSGKQGGTLYNLTDMNFNDMLSSYTVEKGGRGGKSQDGDREGKYDGRDIRRDEDKQILKKDADSKRNSGVSESPQMSNKKSVETFPKDKMPLPPQMPSSQMPLPPQMSNKKPVDISSNTMPSAQVPSSGIAYNTPTGSLFTSDEAKKMVEYHNRTRKDVGVGVINWSESLAGYAQKWADNLAATGCRFQHRPYSGQWAQRYGENISISSGYDAIDYAAKSWAGEKKDYHGQPISDSNSSVWRYTQMVWRNTTQIGCGKVECGGKTIVVCNYNPAGNMTGETPY
ncbi:MAG: hypothetical protein BWK80_12825 [Desulfobacteraceae bacterium IS3]|nr:MAG: hypothetical protein BWK80_12825 [Desulfobacteraceae bacterium IS3]